MSTQNHGSARHNPAFYRLPVGVVTRIVKSLTEEGAEERMRHLFRDTYCFLKTLRLTHKRFADLDYINTILFTSIQLEPTSTGLTSLQRGDISRVAPFVQSISFITPPSWALLFNTYSQNVTASALQRQSQGDDPGCQEPLSEAQLRDGFAAYKHGAEATKALLEESDGQLKAAWVNVMKSLGSRLRKIRFVRQDCDSLSRVNSYEASSSERPCRFGPHHHTDHSHEYGCRSAAAIAGDSLFAMVISCLATSEVASSGVSVRSITIKTEMTGKFAWDTIPGWEKLDLSSLEKIKFDPFIPEDRNRWVKESVFNALPPLDAKEVEQSGCKALHALIDKSHSSLQHLSLDGRGPMTWPGYPPSFEMPALKCLRINGASVNAPMLKDWMARMPQLRHIGMDGLFLSSGLHDREWRHVFDAVRDHPNVSGPNAKGLNVDFCQLQTCDWTEIGYLGVVCRDEAIAPRTPLDPERGEMDDVHWAFERHFYNTVPFEHNYTLRWRMDDWDPEDEDEDEEDIDEDYDNDDYSDEDDGENSKHKAGWLRTVRSGQSSDRN